MEKILRKDKVGVALIAETFFYPWVKLIHIPGTYINAYIFIRYLDNNMSLKNYYNNKISISSSKASTLPRETLESVHFGTK